VSGRYLSVAEREEIAVGVAAGEPLRVIAARLGRAASTVSREIRRNGTRRGYRAVAAQAQAEFRARRPKTARLAGNPRLRGWVQDRLEERWSPEQISAMLKAEFPDEPEMRVSHETIYQAIYVQGRGAARPDPGHGDDQRAARRGR
jgi:IS30 family transposase